MVQGKPATNPEINERTRANTSHTVYPTTLRVIELCGLRTRRPCSPYAAASCSSSDASYTPQQSDEPSVSIVQTDAYKKS
jgi:hypothetical protein